MADSSELIGQLIQGLEPGGFVTRWVVVAEVIDGEGERALWVDADSDMKQWDTYGLLMWALEQERAGYHKARWDEDGEP